MKCKVKFAVNSSPPGAEVLPVQKRRVKFAVKSSPPGAEAFRNWWNNWWNYKKFWLIQASPRSGFRSLSQQGRPPTDHTFRAVR